MAKILLCNPLFLKQNAAEQAVKSPYFPLGLLYLAAYLREHNHTVAIFDGTFEAGEADFEVALQKESPDVVGLTVVLPNREAVLALAGIAQKTGVTVMVGGPDPTLSPQTYLASPAIDLVVHHEGEATLLALLNLIDQNNLSPEALQHELGIAYKNSGGEIVLNRPRPFIENLDELPPPARDLVDVDKYLETWRDENGYASLSISTTRGCPYGCNWCQDAVHGTQFRQRSPASVAAEMKQLKETYNIDRLRVVDDVDGISRAWLEDWAAVAEAKDAAIPFEALNELERKDIPLLDVRDTL